MPDIETAFTFREEMYSAMGAKVPEAPPKKVLFLLRRNARRRIHNLPELLKIVESYNFTYRCGRRAGV